MNSTVKENENGISVKRTILVVEDNELNREILREILADDYNVIEAVDGLDGIEKLRAHFRTLSLILLDVQMPRMNGYEFLEIYRADTLLSSVPLIVTTGSTISEDEERCLALGASDFVTKPYNPKVIMRRIEAIIRLRESIATLRAVEYDNKTGLYTKNAFIHHVSRILDEQREKAFDLFLMNIEDFSYINERYGEKTGDEILALLGKSCLTHKRSGVLCSRYSGDRLVLFGEHIERSIREKEIGEYLDKVYGEAPVDFVLKCAAYENVDHDTKVSVLCDRLVTAVGSIRHQYDRSLVYFDAAMAEKAYRQHLIKDCMEEALEKEQFSVYYQPKHDPKSGAIVGAEALVRWIHPEYGFMSPGEFIPLFEENGFISKLDAYVWSRVCRDLKAWKEAGLKVVPVSMNASRRDFIAVEVADYLEEQLKKTGVEKELIHVEITESLCTNDEIVFEKIKELHDRGFFIELDDFGSGYSSLGMLKDIPMNVIKLDISFARKLEKQKDVVSMIIALAHVMGLKTVAEGVETEDQKNTLLSLGCDSIQGYFYSKPLPLNDFENYLKNH